MKSLLEFSSSIAYYCHMRSTLTALESNSLTKEVLAGRAIEFYINSVRFGFTAKLLEECVQPAIMLGKFLAEVPQNASKLNSFRKLGYFVVPITAELSIVYWDDNALVKAANVSSRQEEWK